MIDLRNLLQNDAAIDRIDHRHDPGQHVADFDLLTDLGPGSAIRLQPPADRGVDLAAGSRVGDHLADHADGAADLAGAADDRPHIEQPLRGLGHEQAAIQQTVGAAIDNTAGRCGGHCGRGGGSGTGWRFMVVTFVGQDAAAEQEQRDCDNRHQTDAGDRVSLDPPGGRSHRRDGAQNAPPGADCAAPEFGCAPRQARFERGPNGALGPVSQGFNLCRQVEPTEAASD